MWQSIARVFGQNLKDDYDMNGEDVWIENIVALIEDGTIPVADLSINAFAVNGE
jgi:fructose-specific component phosphotransferase system IIB-like protein